MSELYMSDDECKFISKKASYCLRHNPAKYGLTLDDEGFVELNKFLSAMDRIHHFHPELTEERIQYIMDHADKQRFQILDGYIRALYGHSLPVKIKKEVGNPPDVLYHGTARRFMSSIQRQGLLPMKRQYVHMSTDIETAIQVGKRRDNKPVILKIDAKRAQEDGIIFYEGNDKTWLCDELPAKYFSEMK